MQVELEYRGGRPKERKRTLPAFTAAGHDAE